MAAAKKQEKPATVAKKTARTKKTATTKKKAASTARKKPENPMPENIWEQWPGEDAEQYMKFCGYRDMAYEGNPESDLKRGFFYVNRLHRRSIRRLAESLGYTAARTLDYLSGKFHWIERAEAYDLDLERRVREAREQATMKMTEEHAMLGARMLRIALARMESIPHDEISAADVIRMADIGVKIERLSRGQSTDNQKVSGSVAHEGTVKVEVEDKIDLSKLTDEELDELERIIGKANPDTGA